MKRLRKSAQRSYRHALAENIRDFMPGRLFGEDPARRDRHRRWRWIVMAVAATLMAWDPSPTLMDRFRSVRTILPSLFPGVRLGDTYQGLVKALVKSGQGIVSRIHEYWRQRLPEIAGPYWRLLGLLAFAVDGSRVECPRTAANEEKLGRAGRMKTGPQLFLTTLYHMGSGCPWAFEVGPGTDSERNHLRGLLPLVPAGAFLVADAGFVGYQLLASILSGGRHVLFRVGSNVRLLRELGYAEQEGPDTVYLWPDKARKGLQPPLVLRLIVLQGGRHPVYLLTDVADEQSLSSQQAGVLYRMRWGVELFYRSLKQTLRHRRMLSEAPAQAQNELIWAVTGLWLLSLMGVEAIVAKKRHPLSLSVALALRCVRQGLQERRGCPSRSKAFQSLLSEAVKDSYVRRTSKAARDYPQRKTQSPPGPPQIATATQAEISLAKEVQHQAKPA